MTASGFYKNCERCIKPFWAYPYNAHKRRFCSTFCSNKFTAQQQRVTKHKNALEKLKSGQEFKGRFWSKLYLNWRYTCLKRDKYKCQNCSKELKPRFLIVHHIKSWDDAPELRVKVSNGITLCRSCHNTIHILPSRKLKSGF